jgi:hypothetical protein
MMFMVALLALLAGGPAPHYRVYVFAAEEPGGQPTDEDKARAEGVREMRESLAKKKQFQIVDRREDADIIVEILGREEENGGEGGFGGAKLSKLTNAIIRLRVSHASGGEGSELKGMGLGGHAAKDAADRIEKWADRDQPTPHKRGKDSPPSTVITLPVA